MLGGPLYRFMFALPIKIIRERLAREFDLNLIQPR
jgi:translation elongation factor EF-4